MRFTRVRDLLGTAVAVALVAWVVIRQVYGALPPFSPVVPVSLLVLAVVEAVAGWQLRGRIHRKPGTVPVQPLLAARAVALAKASSLAAAAATGFWAGLLAFTIPNDSFLAAAKADTRTGLVGVGCGLSLVAAALWLEHCCRAPKRLDHEG